MSGKIDFNDRATRKMVNVERSPDYPIVIVRFDPAAGGQPMPLSLSEAVALADELREAVGQTEEPA